MIGKYALVAYDNVYLNYPVLILNVTYDGWPEGLVEVAYASNDKTDFENKRYYNKSAIIKTYDTVEEMEEAFKMLEAFETLKKQHAFEQNMLLTKMFELLR